MSKDKHVIHSTRFCSCLVFGLLSAHFALGYDIDLHEDICTKAEYLYLNSGAPSQQEPPGQWFLERHGNTILEFTAEEDRSDYGDPLNVNPFFNHFYDPNRPDCLMLTFTQLGMYETAMHRALRFEGICLTTYGSLESNEVGELIGRISHLIADMGVPAHVHLTPHGTSEIELPTWWPSGFSFPYWRDWYEEDYIPGSAHAFSPILLSGYPIVSSISAIVNALSQITHVFPSGCTLYEQESCGECFFGAADGDRCGIDTDYCWQTAPWNVPESAEAAAFGAEIALVCYIGAITHTAAYWRHFIETVAPTIDSTGLDADPDGLYAAVPPDVSAHGYGESPNQAPIVEILWWYSYEPEPDPFPSGDWVEWDRTSNQDLPANGEAVSIRCVALDHCSVDSESRSYTISFDNTPPTIQRVL